MLDRFKVRAILKDIIVQTDHLDRLRSIPVEWCKLQLSRLSFELVTRRKEKLHRDG